MTSSQPMRVTFVIPYFFPAWEYGGQPRSAYELARGLARRGHRVKVLTTDSGGRLRLSGDQIGDGHRFIDGVEVFYYRNVSNWLAFRQRLFWPFRMLQDLERQLADADLLHLHELRSTISPPAYNAARRLGLPYVLSPHGGLRHLGKKRLKTIFDARWGRAILEGAAAVVAISPVEEHDIQSMGVDQTRIHRLPNMLFGGDYSRTAQPGAFRRRWRVAAPKIILFMGRLHWIKGADLLVRAFKQSGISQDAHLVIAGNDDGQEPALRRLVTELGLKEKVTFTGFLDHRGKLEALADADVMVVPSRSEVFAIAALEALMCRRPVVLSEACGLYPMPQPSQGVRSFKSEDIHDLARVLSNALRDPSLAAAAAEGQKFVISEFGSERVTEQAESIYRKVLRG